jgi:exopolyphosphatase/guanosine-5'-triphosphate,3'-diphosphate pyrophosphatase
MKVGVVDIGTNSMRLLITGTEGEVGRWVEVTGLGRGVDASGVLDSQAVDRTIEVLSGFGETMRQEGVDSMAAMATSATRDAGNRDMFLRRATEALEVAPEVIGGEREGALAYAGATSELGSGDWLVSDIGGGSTEFVTAARVMSIDIGSVRLTDRHLPHRPAEEDEMSAATGHVASLFAGVDFTGAVVGVAGTWTTLAAIDLDLPHYDPQRTHHHTMSADAVDEIVNRLAGLTVAETAAIPSMDPGRAPVILAGAVVASGVLRHLGAAELIVSEKDTLDGLATELLGLA